MAKSNFYNLTSSDIVIKFDNIDAAKHFKAWLSGSGEQDYLIWMGCREEEESGQITCKRFDYHSHGNEILASCGRLDED